MLTLATRQRAAQLLNDWDVFFVFFFDRYTSAIKAARDWFWFQGLGPATLFIIQ
jgi:hypothetical protein